MYARLENTVQQVLPQNKIVQVVTMITGEDLHLVCSVLKVTIALQVLESQPYVLQLCIVQQELLQELFVQMVLITLKTASKNQHNADHAQLEDIVKMVKLKGNVMLAMNVIVELMLLMIHQKLVQRIITVKQELVLLLDVNQVK